MQGAGTLDADAPGDTAWLELDDGTRFPGRSFGAAGAAAGEVVFNTGMVGYPEAITDPSYRGQILVLTYPLVGNYGVPAFDRDPRGLLLHFESEGVQVRGLVVSHVESEYHHWNASRSLDAWLRDEGVPGLSDVDTRAIALHLRERGTVPGRIMRPGSPGPEPSATSLAALLDGVACSEPILYGEKGPRIALLDCGVKNNILRCLLRRGASVLRLPWDTDLAAVEYDGLVLSNGPGDPRAYEAPIRHVAKALERPEPVFGICLGCQILGLAAGASAFKLSYGHRGQNQPVVEAGTGRWSITSQNHGYALDPGSLPAGWEPWFTNGNDGTLEGIRQSAGPHRAVQFHPEAVCGPTDTGYLFDRFLEEVRRARR